MARTVVGIFDNETEAKDAVQHLQQEGISQSNIDLTLPRQSGKDQNQSWNSNQETNSDYNRTSSSSGMGSTQNQDSMHGNQGNNSDYNRTGSSSGMGSTQNRDSMHGNQGNNSDYNRTGSSTGMGSTQNRDSMQGNQGNNDDGNIFDRIGNFFSSLFDNDEDANRYTQAGQSRSIVTVHTMSMDEAERAADIMDECGAIDTDNQTNYHHATGGMGRGSSFNESLGNTGSRSRTSGSGQRSRIFDRPVEAHNRLSSDNYQEGSMDMDPLNQKPII